MGFIAREWSRWVKSGKARTEHFMAAFHPTAAEERTSQIVCLVPIADVPAVRHSSRNGCLATIAAFVTKVRAVLRAPC